MAERPLLVHVTPSFAPGGAQVRTTQIMNYLGPEFRHVVISLNGDFSAADRIDPAIELRRLTCRLSRNPVVMVRRLTALVREQQPRLVLTYNWGTIDAVLAAAIHGFGPVIHAEDGFGEDEAVQQRRRRILFRRLVLPHAYRVVAPSNLLVDIMRGVWKLPRTKIEYIPNGVEIEGFEAPSDGHFGSEAVVGAVGHLRREKRYDVLIEVCADLARTVPLRLFMVGDGPERARLEEKARQVDFARRVTFFGNRCDMPDLYRQMDICAFTSATEQMPLAVLEAMASSLAVASMDVGDVKEMVSPENRPFITTTKGAFRAALARLVGDPYLRSRIGVANRLRCAEVYDIRRMLRRYAALYESALRS